MDLTLDIIFNILKVGGTEYLTYSLSKLHLHIFQKIIFKLYFFLHNNGCQAKLVEPKLT